MSSVAPSLEAPIQRRQGPVGLPRLLRGVASGAEPASLAMHRASLPAPAAPSSRPHTDLIDVIERAGLRGRGGASFPTATKLRAVTAGRRRPVVVVNGAEAEPLSSKDRLLLTRAPHLVIDGAAVAAAAIGAERVHLCVESRDDAAVSAIRAALAERSRREPLDFELRVEAAPMHYVGSEERALVNALNGGRAVPTSSPPRPFERGVDGRPTLVQNVETIANMAQIAAYGDRWFRGVGSPTEPGTMLVTVGGAVARPGVAEVAFGTPLSLALEAGGGPTGGMSGVLVGGYFGIWLDGEQARAATLSVEGLRAFGAAPGCGAIAVLPDGTCGLLETCRIMSWLASQSAGQCGPCVNGLASIAGAVRRAYRGEADDAAFARMLRWTREVEGRGACRLPDGAVRFLRSALRVFAADVELHRRGGRCDGAGGPPILPTPSVPVPS